MSLHLHIPQVTDTKWSRSKRRLKVKTSCCGDKKPMSKCKVKTESFEWYGPTVTFWCIGKCNLKTKLDRRRTATVWQVE